MISASPAIIRRLEEQSCNFVVAHYPEFPPVSKRQVRPGRKTTALDCSVRVVDSDREWSQTARSRIGVQPRPEFIAKQQSEDLSSREETILELYFAHLAMQQRVPGANLPWNGRLNRLVVTKLYRQVIGRIAAWRERPIIKAYPYVFLATIGLKCRWGYQERQASVLTAVGVDEFGSREVLGVTEGGMNRATSWDESLRQLKLRGLRGVRLFIGDHRDGLEKSLGSLFDGGEFQSSVEEVHHDFLLRVPIRHLLEMEQRMKGLDASTDWLGARKRMVQIASRLRHLKLTDAAAFFEAQVGASLKHLTFPSEHRRDLRSNTAQVKLLRSLSERSRIVGAFSDGASAVHLVSARLRHIESTVWRERRGEWSRLGRSVRARYEFLAQPGSVS